MIIISERTVFLYLCLYECYPFFGMRLFEPSIRDEKKQESFYETFFLFTATSAASF